MPSLRSWHDETDTLALKTCETDHDWDLSNYAIGLISIVRIAHPQFTLSVSVFFFTKVNISILDMMKNWLCKSSIVAIRRICCLMQNKASYRLRKRVRIVYNRLIILFITVSPIPRCKLYRIWIHEGQKVATIRHE